MKRYVVALGLALLLPCLAAVPEVDKAKAEGSPNAPVVMEVFASFDCPHCREFDEVTLPLVKRDFVNSGKVYLVHREFPLSGPYHPYAREAATYAVAAGRIGKYGQVAEALFQNQATWAVNGNVWGTVSAVLSPAEQKRVQVLAKEPGVVAEVEHDYQEGIALGVNATPTVCVTHGSQRFPIQAQNLNYTFLKSLVDTMAK
ncbi:MAG TPA: thioredoxin domain-containing protein [Bryobacteraceae bacterium]|nr:thioredoxin domain-containing protein [Bryobacteraceae bacterium]